MLGSGRLLVLVKEPAQHFISHGLDPSHGHAWVATSKELKLKRPVVITVGVV